MKKVVFAAVFAIAMSACATRGTKFEMADVDAFQPGVTTYDQAVEKLGKPKAINIAPDGSKSVLWVYVQVAALAGTESRGTRILFDKEGKMIRVASKVE